ncbi:MAG: hypothetical protein RLZZ501_2808, partial [Pseudomonadota bacterium]
MIRLLLVLLLLLPALSAAAEPPLLAGRAEQGGLLAGWAGPGDQVWLDAVAVPVAASGRFLLGFGRDAPAGAVLTLRHP